MYNSASNLQPQPSVFRYLETKFKYTRHICMCNKQASTDTQINAYTSKRQKRCVDRQAFAVFVDSEMSSSSIYSGVCFAVSSSSLPNAYENKPLVKPPRYANGLQHLFMLTHSTTTNTHNPPIIAFVPRYTIAVLREGHTNTQNVNTLPTYTFYVAWHDYIIVNVFCRYL